MRKGQRVIVKGYPDKKLERVVLADEGSYVLVCRPEVYNDIVMSGSPIDKLPEAVMGFPKEDIIQ